MNGADRGRSPQGGVWLGLALAWFLGPGNIAVLASPRDRDAAQVVPLEQIAPEQRETVIEIIHDAHFHRKGKPETFPANPRLYLALLNEPTVALALWKDLSPHPAFLSRVTPDRYEGNDGNGTTAVWEFLLRSPRLHVLLCTLDYVGPRGHPKLSGRIVLIVHSAFFKEASGEPWVQHDIEAFVKIDSRGWKAVATTVRPLIERLLEDQLQEAGLFVSVMARLVEIYPDWATSVVQSQSRAAPTICQDFQDLIVQTRRPGALNGRPHLAENAPSDRVRR